MFDREPDGPTVPTVPAEPPRWRLWLGNALIFAMIGFGLWWFGARLYHAIGTP